MAMAALIIWWVSVNCTTPALRYMASAMVTWSTSAPVCEDTANEPSLVRPALIARIGLWGVMAAAASKNARGSLKLSVCIMITRVPSSCP